MNSETEAARFSLLPVFANSATGTGSPLVIANAQVPFLLYDTLFGANLPVAVSSNASTRLYGFVGASGPVTDIIRTVIEVIVSGLNRWARGGIEIVEAHYGFEEGGAGTPTQGGKFLLIYWSRAMFPDRSGVSKSLELYGAELHRCMKEMKPDLFYLNLARVLYFCR